MTVNDYLQEIALQRDVLKENLTAKGVVTEGCTTYNQLISKIPEIETDKKLGVQNGVWTPTTTAEIFTLTDLDFLPAKFAICCEDVLTKSYTSTLNAINVAMLNLELSKAEQEMIQSGSEIGIVVESGEITAEVNVESNDGKYGICISFEEINKTLDVPYKFKANASHVWCVAEEGWLV